MSYLFEIIMTYISQKYINYSHKWYIALIKNILIFISLSSIILLIEFYKSKWELKISFIEAIRLVLIVGACGGLISFIVIKIIYLFFDDG
ncbi:hypothetical protein C7N83_00655 [Neisseria iguanae]|uniref:Uncharacterized protein n=1 Tax=Neisseria iguanae TaxID=90242 RepID=A0A2P7U3B8_9NEIS|nr:hypothetical protein C7N83_00655 [Neisseria iguanae]